MLTEKELVVLSELRKNSRQSIADISRKNNIPISTVFDTLKRIEKNLEVKYTSLVDFRKLGYWIKTILVLDVNDRKRFEEFLKENKSINSVHIVQNNKTYLVECCFKNMLEQSDFIESAEEFAEKKDEIQVIEDLKREEFVIYI